MPGDVENRTDERLDLRGVGGGEPGEAEFDRRSIIERHDDGVGPAVIGRRAQRRGLDSLACGNEGLHFLERDGRRCPPDGPPRRCPARHVEVEEVVGHVIGDDDLAVAVVLERDGPPAGQWVTERHLERAPFPEHDGAVDDVGLVGGQLGQLQMDLAGAQRAESVGKQALDELHSAGGKPVPEHLFLPFISSAFVPTATMPGPVRAFADNQPVTSIVNTIRELLAQHPVGSDVWIALSWCVGVLLATYVLAMLAYRRKVA